MIEHDAARLSLVDLVVPGLGEPTRTAALRGHVATCDECQAELAEIEHLHLALQAAGSAPRPPDRLRRRVLASSAPQRGGTATAWRTTAMVLAGICVVLAAMFVLALIAG